MRRVASVLPGASWIALYTVLVLGWYRYPERIWGVYSLVDGRWAAWNGEAILRWSRFLDLSPFNILSGMGSLFLPNLPWLNPGALVLASPFDEMTKFVLSYTIYAAEIAVSIVLLMRALGFSWIAGQIGAQLHLVFPLFTRMVMGHGPPAHHESWL